MAKTLENGSFQDPQGNAVNAGTVEFVLSQDAMIIVGGQVAPTRVSATLTSSGDMPGAFTILANDELTPSGTFYLVTVFDSNGARVFGPERWVLSGASPIDLDTLTPTIVDPAFADPILSNPAAAQAIEGFDLTTPIFNSIRVVDGTKFTTIQEAIDDACAAFAPVYVPAGTYVLTTGLTACDNLKLYGAGAGATIIQAGANIDLLNDDGTQMENIEISGITFDGQKGTWTGAGIRFDQGTATNIFIHDCEFLDIARAGINIVGANNTDVVIHANKFKNIGTDQNDTAPGNASIYLDGVTRGTITGNTIDTSPWAGIRVASFNTVNGITITGNTIQNCSYGMATTGILFTNLIISGNSIEESTSSNPKNGIDAGGVVGFSIIGNTITATTNNFGSGINTDGASNGSVVGNIVAGTFSSGIQLGANTFSATSDVVVTGNVVEGHTRGITDFGTTGTVTRLLVYGNIVRSNTTDYLLSFATSFQGLVLSDSQLNPLEGELSNVPRWILKIVDFGDMTAGSTADTFTLWTLPANTMIHDIVGTVVTAWAGGTISAAVASVGTNGGSANDLTLDDNFFSAATVYELHDATASGGKGTLLFDSTDKFAPYMAVAAATVELQMDLTGDNHANATAGQARIYALVSQPLGNTTSEAN